MRLKYSHKKQVLFISALAVMAMLLLSIKLFEKKKGSKYPETPIAAEQKTDLSLIQITISEKSYIKLKKKRDKAVVLGLLEVEDSDFVPATLRYNDIDFPAEIRLKGDWATHVIGEKWSFRVKLKNDKTILGMRKFSLHHPRARNYLNEWLYHNAMKRENLMGLRYNFVEGQIHIKSKEGDYINKEVGIYALEESFDKRTIESNKRKESVIIKFSEDYFWNEVKKSDQIAKEYGLKYYEFLNRYAKPPVTVFSESKVLSDSTMNNYFKLSKNLLYDYMSNEVKISDVFDVDKLAMDTALMNLFGAAHGGDLINLRFYYNPITSRLEPISFDGNSGIKLKTFRYALYYNNTERRKDTIYLKKLVVALEKVSNPNYIDDLININKKEYDFYEKSLKTEFLVPLFEKENLIYNQSKIRNTIVDIKKELNIAKEKQ